MERDSEEIEKINDADCIVFMSAYRVNDIKKGLPFFKRANISKLLASHHITSIMTKDKMITAKGNLKVNIDFDSYHQKSTYSFDVSDKRHKLEEYNEEIEQMEWAIALAHSLELLLDNNLFEFSFFVNMESFFVDFESKVYQVDPFVFVLNNVIYISFELIDYGTGNPLTCEDIYGRVNNYNLKRISRVRFLGQNKMTLDNRTISEIIFENFVSVIEDGSKGRYKIEHMSYVYNIFVRSTTIINMTEYFGRVLGEAVPEGGINNISGNKGYEYYSQEYLGIIRPLQENYTRQVLWDGQLLEALKMFLLLNQIVTYDITNNLKETLGRQMYMDRLLLMSNVPIITISAIKNVQGTEIFNRYKDSIDFKISYLNMKNERRKSTNALLMNILLYILAFIGSIGTLQVLQEELGWSFKVSSIVVTSIFVILGVVWIFLEKRLYK